MKPLLGKLGISLDELEHMLTQKPAEVQPVEVKPAAKGKPPLPTVEES
ncbi:MAG: hypothetical protein NTZ17_04375 [Phycisphaerae bacterium]|nr:hypothetical protein [Phycisphaerae bacterium]